MKLFSISVEPIQLIAIALLALGLLALRRFLQFSVVLYGKRIENYALSEPGLEYKFALHNAEDVELRTKGALELSIDILDKYGRFVEEPVVFAGPSVLRLQDSTINRSKLSMRFNGLAEYDTWIIDCKTNEEARNLKLELHEVPSKHSILRRIASRFSVSRLVISSDLQVAVSGGDSKPSRKTVVAWALAACGFYLMPIGFHESAWFPLSSFFSEFDPGLDLPLLLSLVAFSSILAFISRRRVPPVVQGYREDSLAAREAAPRSTNAGLAKE